MVVEICVNHLLKHIAIENALIAIFVFYGAKWGVMSLVIAVFGPSHWKSISFTGVKNWGKIEEGIIGF